MSVDTVTPMPEMSVGSRLIVQTIDGDQTGQSSAPASKVMNGEASTVECVKISSYRPQAPVDTAVV